MSVDKIQMTCRVKSGKLDLTQAQLGLIAVWEQKREGKEVTLTLAPKRENRSLRANRYYWGVVLTTIAGETGNTAEDLHIAFRDMFLARRFIKVGSKEIEVRKTTTDLTPQEFQRYTDQVVAFAASELGLNIPLPG